MSHADMPMHCQPTPQGTSSFDEPKVGDWAILTKSSCAGATNELCKFQPVESRLPMWKSAFTTELWLLLRNVSRITVTMPTSTVLWCYVGLIRCYWSTFTIRSHVWHSSRSSLRRTKIVAERPPFCK